MQRTSELLKEANMAIQMLLCISLEACWNRWPLHLLQSIGLQGSKIKLTKYVFMHPSLESHA